MKNYEYLVESISEVTGDCLIWERGKYGDGYGAVKVDGRKRLTHRVALQLTKPRPMGKVCSIKGEWVPGHKLDAAHGPCHNRLCFNPQHLSWKTRAENQADRKRDGTDVYASNKDSGNCKLSNADVARIRELWEGPHRGPDGTGPTQQELADQFGCDRSNIGHIVNGHTRTSPVTAQPNEELQQV
jgi:hypothetical protein